MKFFLLIVIIYLNTSSISAQFYKDSSHYKEAVYVAPLITYGSNPQGGDNNLYSGISLGFGVPFGFRLSDRILFTTGFTYQSNNFSIKPTSDYTFETMHLIAIHIMDKYRFASFYIP